MYDVSQRVQTALIVRPDLSTGRTIPLVCLVLELASQPSQPEELPTAKASPGKARYSWSIFRKISRH